MDEFGLPPLYNVRPDTNLTDLIERNAEQCPDIAVVGHKVDGRWHHLTAAQVRAEVSATARGLTVAS